MAFVGDIRGPIDQRQDEHAEYRGDSFVDHESGRVPGADRVQTLASYVKRAARGSDFSRRDVARTVMQIAERSHAAPSRGEGVSPNRELPDAIETLVYPYRDDPFVRAGMRTLRTDRAHGDGPATQARHERKASRAGQIPRQLSRRLSQSWNAG